MPRYWAFFMTAAILTMTSLAEAAAPAGRKTEQGRFVIEMQAAAPLKTGSNSITLYMPAQRALDAEQQAPRHLIHGAGTAAARYALQLAAEDESEDPPEYPPHETLFTPRVQRRIDADTSVSVCLEGSVSHDPIISTGRPKAN